MSNLDDFFKKRDKKKKTAKSKFPTLDTDEFAKKLETLAVETLNDDQDVQADLDQEVVSSSSNLAPLTSNNFTASSVGTSRDINAGEQEEEWKPFDSDENKDYSGLKINIQGWKIEDQESGNDANADENEKKTNCPWAAPSQLKKVVEQEEPAKLEKSEEKITEKQQEETPAQTASSSSSSSAAAAAATTKPAESTTSTGAYVPPALRRQMQQTNDENSKPSAASTASTTTTTESSGKYIPPSMRANAASGGSSSAIPPTSVNYRRPNKSQPNINDTLEFPTLDANAAESSNNPSDKLTNGNSNDRFEMPKKSSNIQQKTTGGMIDLENKYTALSTNN